MRDLIAVGDGATFDHAFSADDVLDYIRISGDDNSIARLSVTARTSEGVIRGEVVVKLPFSASAAPESGGA
jgi:hypothetical protein